MLPVHAPGTDLGKFGVGIDLQTPAVVVSDMPVKGVELVEGQKVDITFHKLHIEKVP